MHRYLTPTVSRSAVRRAVRVLAALACAGAVPAAAQLAATSTAPGSAASLPRISFHLEEATIDDIQQAILAGELTTERLVELYLARIKAYNGTCVNQPQGILGPITTIPNAGQINALQTLNLRPATRERWGFDARKARSMTDRVDSASEMPDALETAAAQDEAFARTGRLVGPLHGAVIAIKDQYDTKDMRTTSGADAQYANDRRRSCRPGSTAASVSACSVLMVVACAAASTRTTAWRSRQATGTWRTRQ